MIYQFRELETDEFIVIGADPAESGDYSTFAAVSKKYADVVMVGQSKEESSQLGHTLNHVGRWIEKRTGIFPAIAPERNFGNSTITELKNLNYPNIFRMPTSFVDVSDSVTEKYGWHTNTATRPKMLDDLALAIRQGSLKIPCKQIIDELFTFIRNERTGKPEADKGCHDDLVISLAIAWQLYQVSSPPSSARDIRRVASNNQNLITKWSI